MKKVLFMFVAVLALVSCQKGAEKSSEATADSTKTEAVEEKTADATELVAHEIQIAVTGSADGGQTDHLVQSDPTIHDRILRIHIHGKVHLLIDESEHQGFVTNQRLVVALRVADGPLVRPLVGQLVPHFSRTPLLVPLLLDPLDPMVRHAHIRMSAQRGA